nr:hypothetical protein [Tanacetum cinerariifolium]
MPHFHDDPLNESLYENSTSHGSSSNVRPIHTPFKSLGRWNKDHPTANVIGDASHSISTRKKLQTNAMWCDFDAFLPSVEPKNFKQAMTKPSWIDAMLEEISNVKGYKIMSCIIAQQTKHDLELVPEEKRLEIRKYVLEVYMHQFLDTIISMIIPTDFDELPTDEDIVSFFKELGHTREIKSIIDVVVDQMHQPWRAFATIINRSLSRKTTGLDKLRLSRAQILWAIYYKKNVDYVELLLEYFTYQIDNRDVHKKSLRDFHKIHPSGSGTVTKITSKDAKIKPSVTNKGNGAKPWVLYVTEEESTVSEAKSWGRDEDDRNNDRDSKSKGSDQESDSGDDNTQSDNEKGLDSEHETNENEIGFESDQEENEEEVQDDEEEKDDEFVKTLSISTNDKDETYDESKVEDKAEGDEDKGMNYTTILFDDDVNVRLNEPVDTDEGFIQKEGTDAEMINVDQGNENLEISINQVIEDAHVTISTVSKMTEFLVTSSYHSSDLASKFLNFSDIPHTNAEIVSPMDVHVHHEIPSN